MYIRLLSDSLEHWTDELTKEALIEHALTCHDEMLETFSGRGDTIYRLLGAEVAYDRALIKLCEAFNIECDVVNFAFPNQERLRVERALATNGVDLGALARVQQL
ncbi:MAG TPA: hypothetical protein VII67_01430 [Acidimicrobiales bacterium]